MRTIGYNFPTYCTCMILAINNNYFPTKLPPIVSNIRTMSSVKYELNRYEGCPASLCAIFGV
jgi:hypothetical protein